MTHDPQIFATARERLPLPRLMTTIGDGKYTTKNAPCPFCEARGEWKPSDKGKWAVFRKNGRDSFKCHKPGCDANEPSSGIGHNEIGYLALRKGIPVNEAAVEFLKLAVPEILEQQERERAEKSKPKPPEKPPDNIVTITGEKVKPPDPPTPPTSGGGGGDRNGSSPNVWHALWKKLVLNADDRAKLKRDRGFSDDTITKLGFRSSNHSNRIHLEALREEFPIELLLEHRIWQDKDKKGRPYRDGPQPNSQFLGWGRTNKKDENGEWLWGDTKPILIPYLDEHGTCFYLRPHKGGPRRPSDIDDDDEEYAGGYAYCPFLLSELATVSDGTIILTEGEFKAGALFQCGIPALAIPGTSFMRKRPFRFALLNLLRRAAVTEIVIVFDNEVKDDPRFEDKYKPDPWDRWDTPMWAEYIAIDLGRELNGNVRIGVIPDEFRENGKADFDSVLRSFAQRDGLETGTNRAKRTFSKILDDARPRVHARELFPSEPSRIIQCKLNRLFYKQLVPTGGDKESKLASKYAAIDEHDLATAFRGVIGCYYKRRSVSKDDRKLYVTRAEKLAIEIEKARASGVNGSELAKLRTSHSAEWDKARGLPEPISDFTLSCEFKLHTADHKTIRLVRIKNRSDNRQDPKLFHIDPASLARPANFREFLIGTGKGIWKTGQEHLDNLAEDMDHRSYYRDIYEINFYGFHRESGLWFFGDCAFGRNNELIEADANNIFWSEGVGYQIDSAIDERGTTFEQKAPLLLSPHDAKPASLDPKLLFAAVAEDFFNTIGGFDAWLALGITFAFAAAPELLARGGHPGLWLFGKLSGGKTTIARWLMRIWGFPLLPGIRLGEGTTHVGMNRNLAQYSNLPVWFDEYRTRDITPQKEEVLRGAFDRNSSSKGMADYTNRTKSAKIFTTPVVTGESSSSDGATRSRYGHVSVTDRRRIGNGAARYIKMQDDCKHYYILGRFLMQHRGEFVKNMLGYLNEWMDEAAVRERMLQERVRFVHGVGYAAFRAAADLLQFPIPNISEFQLGLITHGEQAMQDVVDETFLNRFWSDIISGIQRRAIKSHFFAIRYVITEDDGQLKPAMPGDEKSFQVCFIAPNPVFDEYSKDMRARGLVPPLDSGDIRREMAKEPYWVPSPKTSDRVHRMRFSGTRATCWVINLGKTEGGDYLFPHAEDLIAVLSAEEEV